VGILVPILSNPYFVEIINAIEKILTERGIYAYICDCKGSVELEQKYTEELLMRNVDALMVIETSTMNTKHNYFLSRKFDCPVILINQHTRPYGDNYIVRCDQKPGLAAFLEEVRRNNLFPFLLLISSADIYSYKLKEDIFLEWKAAWKISGKKAGIYKIEKPFHGDDDNDKSVIRAYNAAKEILSSASRPRSILAGNDLKAWGVLAAARELGIQVPRQLAVAGVDNTFLSKINALSLGAVDLRMDDLGTMAAELYLEIKTNPTAKHRKIRVIPSQYTPPASTIP
jgi:LacI family transcriptional regulator